MRHNPCDEIRAHSTNRANNAHRQSMTLRGGPHKNYGAAGMFVVTEDSSDKFRIVFVSEDGGANGFPGAPATWTYIIRDVVSGKILATNCPLFFARVISGPCLPGNYGIAWNSGFNGAKGFTGAVGNMPSSGSGSGSGTPKPTNWRLMFVDEQFGTTIAVSTCG